MDPMYRTVFTFSLIIGCFIQLPVRMLPASAGGQDPRDLHFSDMSQYPYENNPIELKGLKGASVSETNNKHEPFFQQRPNGVFHSNAIIGSHSEVLSRLKENENQARLPGHPEFYVGKVPAGISVDINSVVVKSPVQTDNGRPGDDFLGSRMKHVSDRLVNVTSNLGEMKNIFTSYSYEKKTKSDNPLSDQQPSSDQHGSAIFDTDKSISQNNIDTSTLHHSKNNSATTIMNPRSKFVEGIYWTPSVELHCPKGFSDLDLQRWRTKVKTLEVVKIEEGCGSMQNRLVIFNDSTKACVRYRLNTDLMQGDIYSYYLGQLLGIKHTPPTYLVIADKGSKQWRRVRDDMISAKWSDQKPLILSKWIDNLTPVYAPGELRDQTRQLHPPDIRLDTPMSELCSLVQWSDLIVHDYMSVNLDRVVNNMFNLRWNPSMMNKPIHNLEQESDTGQLVFLDNESGLFHGYRLLDTYGQFHQSLLDSVCMFRRNTVDTIEKLYRDGNVGDQLMNLYQKHEDFHALLPRLPRKNVETLQKRLESVYKQIKKCQSVYSGN